MPSFTNNFAPMVDNETLTEQQIIQLLKMQIIKFTDLPPAVKTAVEEAISEKGTGATAQNLRDEKLKLIKMLGDKLRKKKS